MDGYAGQYAAFISFQSGRKEMQEGTGEAMVSMLKCFHRKNGVLPEHMIIYRDGVSDGNFGNVLAFELPPIKAAIDDYCSSLGILESNPIKVTIVVCHKRHHSRFVYKDNQEFVNPCPGLCVDAMGGTASVTSDLLYEFYINSHTAIQGTAKPCKYALIYDEIGFKVRQCVP